MPELPEVETVKNVLKKKIVGLTIKSVTIHHPKMIKGIDVEDFSTNLVGQTINNITRRGKYIIFQMSDWFMLSHLRMEGKFFHGKDVEFAREKHIHARFDLSDGSVLVYEDVRKFGTFHLYALGIDLEKTAPFLVLGPEPWDTDFNIENFSKQIKGKKTPIKSLLLSQKLITGLGNIYVDEVLFASNVHPSKASNTLTKAEITAIIKHTRDILKHAIKHKGTTIKTFTSAHGFEGMYQEFLKVHTKKDEPCPTCETTILKTKVGGRGTYYCPTCQK